ncbi:uncharacterized protein [Chiloscyllium punctatum]|uniref:uncharacterized protein isoform X2 n=1 Tax=Chiloscyllium punctatum TaxID=137246 RepID=UPI003B641C0A
MLQWRWHVIVGKFKQEDATKALDHQLGLNRVTESSQPEARKKGLNHVSIKNNHLTVLALFQGKQPQYVRSLFITKALQPRKLVNFIQFQYDFSALKLYASATPNRSKGQQLRGCLRHGCQSRKLVRAACLLVGGAATGPNLGYMMTSSSTPASERVPLDFKELGIHSSDCCQDTEPGSGYNSFECETMDQDFDTFDFGGFAF